MPESTTYSYRVLLLASVAIVTLGGGVRAASYNNATPDLGAGPLYTLNTGDSLSNSSTIASTAAFGTAVDVNAAGALFITNSGTISGPQSGVLIGLGASIATITSGGLITASFGGANGLLVSGTLGTITNSAGGTIQAIGGGASGITVAGEVSSIVNAGTVQAFGGAANAINLNSGSIGSIGNSGTIQTGWTAIDVTGGNLGTIDNSGTLATLHTTINIAGGTVGTISNSGLILVSGLGTAIAVGVDGPGGAVGSIINAGGTIESTLSGNAILVGSTSGVAASIGTITNSGLIQSSATFAAIGVAPTGTIASIVNNAGGIIQTTGANANAIDVAGMVGSIVNGGLVQTGVGPLFGTGAAINVALGGSVSSVTNTGTILAATLSSTIDSVAGINVVGSVGTIGNSGLILTTGDFDNGINVTGSVAGITNMAGGTIHTSNANEAAINVIGAVGSIANATGGLIVVSGEGDAAIAVTGTVGSISNATGALIHAVGGGNSGIVVSGAAGSVLNAGSIEATDGNGNAVSVSGSVDLLNNSGVINAASTSDNAIAVSGTVNTLDNSNFIQATGMFDSAVTVRGTVNTLDNTGLIQATGNFGAAIDVNNGGTIGGIDNAGGTIQSFQLDNPILVGAASSIGTISNSGLIRSPGSFAAIAINPTGTITNIANNAGGVVQTTGANAAVIDVGGSLGTIGNSGLIQTAAGGVAINVDPGGAVGSIINSGGTIQSVASGNAIRVGSTTGAVATIGTITNSGLIQSANSAIEVASTGTIGSIGNDSGGTIQSIGAPGNAIDVNGSVGSIGNSGLIQVNGLAFGTPISIEGHVGTIANSGTIQVTIADSTALNVGGTLNLLRNSGLIQASNSLNASGIEVFGTIGTLANQAGGTIQSNRGAAVSVGGTVGTIDNAAGAVVQTNGIAIVVSGTVGTIDNAGTIKANGPSRSDGIGGGYIGTIVNSGLIQVVGDLSYGIGVLNTVNTLDNSGTIQASGTASNAIIVTGSGNAIVNSGLIQSTGANDIALLNDGSVGSIVNSGTIVAQQGTAIAMGATGQVTSGITNTLSGLIQGGAGDGSGVAIDNSASTRMLTIDTAGTVVGQIKLGRGGDTLNVTGGSIVGAITGQLGRNDTVNFDLTGSFTTAGSIADVDTVNANTGTLRLQNPVSPVFAFNIASGATVALNANVEAAGFNNAGLVAIGAGNPAIAGSYTQSSNGALGVTVVQGAAGKLTVIGSANVAGGPDTVAVRVPITTDPFGLVGQSEHVLASAALTVADAGLLTASSDNAGIGFGLTNTATDLVLTARAQNAGQALYAATTDVNLAFAPVGSIATPNDIAVQHYLVQVLAGLALSGQAPLAHRIDTLLNTLAPGALVQLERQLAPSTLFTTSLNLAAAADVLSSGLGAISDRLAIARLDPAQTGVAEGDEVRRGFTVWGQPFGALTSQDAKDGVDGYSVGSYGVTLGGDTLVQDDLRVGVALTLGNSDVTFDGYTSGSKGSIFSSQLALYGAWYLRNFFVDGALAVGYNQYKRHDVVSAFDIALDSSSGGTQISGKLGAGYDWRVNGAVVTPYASVQQVHFNFASYTTTGGSAYGLDMHVNGASVDLTQTRFGGRVAYPVRLPDGGTLSPEIHAYYLHDFGNSQLTASYTTADVAGPATFAFTGAPVDRDIYNVGVSVSLLRSTAWSFAGGYDFAGRASSSEHNFFVRAMLNF